MKRIPKIDNPQMFDAVISEVQDFLGDRFSWLDHVFGIVERISRFIDGKKFNCAALFRDSEQGENYEQIEPCVELGNFCYFLLNDPQKLDRTDEDLITAPFSAIFWYDMRQVSNEPSHRNREEVKASILRAFKDIRLRTGRITINTVYENPERIFSEFSYDHTQNQCLMSPYAGIRVEGEITAKIPCFGPLREQ